MKQLFVALITIVIAGACSQSDSKIAALEETFKQQAEEIAKLKEVQIAEAKDDRVARVEDIFHYRKSF
jgi:hypothetical protein